VEEKEGGGGEGGRSKTTPIYLKGDKFLSGLGSAAKGEKGKGALYC